MYSRANRNHFGRLLSFEDQGQHINRDAANKVFNKLHIRSEINVISCSKMTIKEWVVAYPSAPHGKINCVEYSFDTFHCDYYECYDNGRVWAQFENIKCFKNDCNVRKKMFLYI